ncbi:Holliday junction branch migration protein RuvA [Candidatus Dojkabacteria bacterium]|nr:Holliday junction branch migration protein RuvA [Candidatus Dojkabacteria bacterium]
MQLASKRRMSYNNPMITAITGQRERINKTEKDTSIELTTSAGITYRIYIPIRIIHQIETEIRKAENTDKTITIYTSHRVREDSQTLYGFLNREERDFFEVLLGVSGVGPKIALAILDTYILNELKEFIETADIAALQKVSGLGKKGSQKIIVDLEGKLADLGVGDLDFSDDAVANSGILAQVEGALEGLGFHGKELEGMLERAKVVLKGDSEVGVEGLIEGVLRGDGG